MLPSHKPSGLIQSVLRFICFILITPSSLRAGMERARAQWRQLGRPAVPVDLDYVVMQRAAGVSWQMVQRGHPVMTLPNGRRKKPSITTIRNAHRRRPAVGELPMVPERNLQ